MSPGSEKKKICIAYLWKKREKTINEEALHPVEDMYEILFEQEKIMKEVRFFNRDPYNKRGTNTVHSEIVSNLGPQSVNLIFTGF